MLQVGHHACPRAIYCIMPPKHTSPHLSLASAVQQQQNSTRFAACGGLGLACDPQHPSPSQMDSSGVSHPVFRKLALHAEVPCSCITSSCLFRIFIQVAKIILLFHGIPCSFPALDAGAGRAQPAPKGLETEASTPGPAVAQHSSRYYSHGERLNRSVSALKNGDFMPFQLTKRNN